SEGSTKLAKSFTRPTFVTNSWHHQAVKIVSPGGVVAARAPDGIVEAVEWEEYRAAGVQWHPERMVQNAESKALASYFIEQCSNRAS
ncbi:MAG: gamma-glutamyl-gamma-aminobutyrate hydrolase family protein, partial [bacterium]|nr:gamma-glutamyl-gamma-aminobutyrate hydrolase family protein [bacterium]